MFRTIEVSMSNRVGGHRNVTNNTLDMLAGVWSIVNAVCFERCHLEDLCSDIFIIVQNIHNDRKLANSQKVNIRKK